MKPADAVAALRQRMEALGLDAWLVPTADAHQSEYVAPCWQRRVFLTGFTGSAGTAAILQDSGGLWVDFRYWIQAEAELAGSGVQLFKLGAPGVPELEEHLVKVLPEGARVGANPWVFPIEKWESMRNALLRDGNLELVPVEEDLVDQVWGAARPPAPAAPVRVHPDALAGETVASKLGRVAAALEAQDLDLLLVGSLDEVAWLFNLRGADIDFNPVFVAWALVGRDGATLFTRLDRIPEAVRAALPGNVALRPYEDMEGALREAAAAGRSIWADRGTTAYQVVRLVTLSEGHIRTSTTPIAAWKAAKNEAELAGMRAAHRRDGVAMARFFRWLEEALPGGGLTERSVEARVEAFRAEAEGWVGPSFRTIAGYGPHGAIVHYSATEETDATILPEGILLLDSGGQYTDGTTDVTRTLALSEPTEEQRRFYTMVLKGHLALGRVRFPEGTNGYQLDVVARAPLWEAGLSYGHGTGHGIGAHLSVHEGPFSVSLRKNLQPLEPGNTLSNEPGVYREGGFGVRIENVVEVLPPVQKEFGSFLSFRDLTLVPYDRKLIAPALLTATERAQVDAYHARVWTELSPLLQGPDLAWLREATRPL